MNVLAVIPVNKSRNIEIRSKSEGHSIFQGYSSIDTCSIVRPLYHRKMKIV